MLDLKNIIKQEIANYYLKRIDFLLSLCESEIEQLFLLNLIKYFEDTYGLGDQININWDFSQDNILPGKYHVNGKNEVLVPHSITFKSHVEADVIPQYLIKTSTDNFRVDFLFKVKRYDNTIANFCIECDGYDFHQKTKEQVTRDYLRDLKLKSLGFTVIRFSGSDLFNDTKNNNFKNKIELILKCSIIDLLEKEYNEMKICINDLFKAGEISETYFKKLMKENEDYYLS